MNLKELKSKARVLKATANVGKSGITETVVKEILSQLKRKKLIKVKLKDKEMAKDLAEKTEATIILQIGKTVALYKK